MVETTLGLGDYRYKYLYGCTYLRYARTFVYRPGTLQLYMYGNKLGSYLARAAIQIEAPSSRIWHRSHTNTFTAGHVQGQSIRSESHMRVLWPEHRLIISVVQNSVST